MAIRAKNRRLGVVDYPDIAPQRCLMAGYAQVGRSGVRQRFAGPLVAVVTGNTQPRGSLEAPADMTLPAFNQTMTACQGKSRGKMIE